MDQLGSDDRSVICCRENRRDKSSNLVFESSKSNSRIRPAVDNSKVDLRSKVLYPLLAAYLIGYESLYNDVSHFLECGGAQKYDWLILTPSDLGNLCGILPLDLNSRFSLQNVILKNCIDGTFINNTDEKTLLSLIPDLSSISLRVLKTVCWASTTDWRVDARVCAPGIHPLAYAGLATDVTSLCPEDRENICRANQAATFHGDGVVYGSLIPLGYTDSRWKSHSSTNMLHMIPAGQVKSKFVMLRKSVANASQIVHGTPVPGTCEYDIYRVGRASCCDLVVKGTLHVSSNSRKLKKNASTIQLSSQVSKVALTIACSRMPPYSAHVYAAEGTIPIRRRGTSQSRAPEDWLSSYGVRIWRPELSSWVEITTAGNARGLPRPKLDVPGPAQQIPYSQLPPEAHNTWAWNLLTDGCILDISGQYIMFQSTLNMATKVVIPPSLVMNSLNSMQATCPVLYEKIVFNFAPPMQRLESAIRERLEGIEQRSYISNRSTVAESYDHSFNCAAVEDQGRPMVFPECGHCFGYNRRLLDARQCPMCRTPGSIMPLVFPFHADIDAGKPTHCFSPCGHAASLDVCKYWGDNGPIFFNYLESLLQRTTKRLPRLGFNPPAALRGENQVPSLQSRRGSAPIAQVATDGTRNRDQPDSFSGSEGAYQARIPPGSTYPREGESNNSRLNGPTKRFKICPFCAGELSHRRPYSKLIFQSEASDNDDDPLSWNQLQTDGSLQQPKRLSSKDEKNLLRSAYSSRTGNLNQYYTQQPPYPVV